MHQNNKRVFAQQSTHSLVHESSLQASIIRSKIKRVINRVNPQGMPVLILYWACSSPDSSEDNGFNVTLQGQPSVLTQDCIELERYRTNCFNQGCRFVGQETKDENWLAGRAIQTRVADQGTKREHVSGHTLGLLVLPVFFRQGTHKVTAGIIEFVTVVPKASYIEDFVQIDNLLKDEGLESEGLAKMIKVQYEDMIKFPLSFSAKFKDLQKEVRKIEKLKNKNFLIKYNDTNGNYLPILCDQDLKVCIHESISRETTLIRMIVKLVA